MNTENYVPYGIEWEKEMDKFPKLALIRMLGGARAKFGEAEQRIKELKSTIRTFGELNNRLAEDLRTANGRIQELEATNDRLSHLIAGAEQRGYSKALQEVADTVKLEAAQPTQDSNPK